MGIDEINSMGKVVKNKLKISWLAVLLWLASKQAHSLCFFAKVPGTTRLLSKERGNQGQWCL